MILKYFTKNKDAFPCIFWVRGLLLNIARNKLTALKWNCDEKETRKGVLIWNPPLSKYFLYIHIPYL